MGTSAAEGLSPPSGDRWPGWDTPQRAPGSRTPHSNLLRRGPQAPPRLWGHLPQTPRKRVSKGQVGVGDSGELPRARASRDCRGLPRAPAPAAAEEQSPALPTQQQGGGRASSHGFIRRAPRVRRSRCRRRRRATGRAAASVFPQGPVPLHCSRGWGGRRRTPPRQRGGSKRYSRSGCRSLCSLFLFLANSLSMAITSFSNSAGVGFASAVKTERGSERMAPSCPKAPTTAVTPPSPAPTARHGAGALASERAGPRAAAPYLWPSSKCPSRCWAR